MKALPDEHPKGHPYVTDHLYVPETDESMTLGCQHCSPRQALCGYSPISHPDPASPDTVTPGGVSAWTPPGRLPIGQYRVTLLVTGDAVGPDTLYWLLLDRLANGGKGAFISGRVETIEELPRTDGK